MLIRDNRGKFANDTMRELCNLLGVNIKNTGA